MPDAAAKLAQEKLQLRAELKKKLHALDEPTRQSHSEQLLTKLKNHLETLRLSQNGNYGKMLAFYPLLKLEPDIRPLLFAQGKSTGLLLPRIEGKALHPSQVTHQDQLLRSEFGTFDPPPSAPSIDPSELEAVLVPALGFSRSGQRLGRGGGFYDRCLSQLPPTCQRIGLCFECQLHPSLPEEAHDQRVHTILTESRHIQVTAKGISENLA